MNTKRARDFVSKFLVLLLNSGGIPVTGQKYGQLIALQKYYLIYSFIFLTSCQVLSLKTFNHLYEATIALAFIFNGLFLNIPTIILHLKKENFLKISEIVSHDFKVNASTQFRKFFFSYGISYISCYSLMLLSPVLFFPISGHKVGDPGTLLIPCWFPWTIDTLTKYLLTVTLQFSWLFALSLPILLGFTFTAYFVVEVRFQFDRLCHAIELTQGEFTTLPNKNWAAGNEDLMILNLCIHQHQIILRFIRNFTAAYNIAFAANLMYSTTNMALILFSLLSSPKTIASVSQHVLTFLMVILYFLLYCFIGQILKEANNKLKATLYGVEWYSKSLEFQKKLLLFLCLVEHGPALKFGVRYVASFELFSDILKMSYSYLNIMMKTFSR